MAAYLCLILVAIVTVRTSGATQMNNSTSGESTGSMMTNSLWFNLKNINITNCNNTVVDISEIGEGDNGLFCHTTFPYCCKSTFQMSGNTTLDPSTIKGEFYYPNGTALGKESSNDSLYRNRRFDEQFIRLNRRNNVTSPTGVYRCELPISNTTNMSIYINITSNFKSPADITTTTTASEATTPGTISTESDSESEVTSLSHTGSTPDTTTCTSESESDTSSTSSDSSNESDNSGGIIAGILVVVIILVVGGVLTGIFLWRYKFSKKKDARLEGLYAVVNKKKRGSSPPPEPRADETARLEGLYSVVNKKKAPPIPEFKGASSPPPEQGDDELARLEGLYSVVNKKKPPPIPEFKGGSSPPPEQQETGADGLARLEGLYSVVNKKKACRRSGVPVTEFGRVVIDKHANGNVKFAQDYESLDKGESGHVIIAAKTTKNKPLNRFKNITVYDDNRIDLHGDGYSDNEYINACYVSGYVVPNKFIATQGPLPNTVIDFWRMIWQEKPSAIVMLTNLEEGNKVKCEQYWPESGKESYGPFSVAIRKQQTLADYTIRTIVVSSAQSTLKLTQFHFTAWPDHGVPDYATPVLAFHRRIRSQYKSSKGPIIVHCSAGVGRTGTYITLDNVLDQIEAEGVVDIDGVIVKARNQRMKMVQTKEQYVFIHDAILEFLTCGDTQISSANLRLELDKLSRVDPSHQCTGYQHQFNVLDQVTPSPTEVNCSTALRNKDKNRGDKYLPVEQFRVVLWGGQQDYIHAVTANGYKHHRAYIIAQNPLKSTVRNFWKVITDRKCAAIVMLSQREEKGEEACAMYWADEGAQVYGEFDVEVMEKNESMGFTITQLAVENLRTHQSHQVTQFHVTNWSPDGTCSNLKVITDVIEEVTKVQRRTGNNPILVHCSDTVSRSGMFCAIATTIDRCKTEGVVDVFQVVKALRIHKPGAVLTVEQYKLVHEAILVFLDSFDTYSNFQQ